MPMSVSKKNRPEAHQVEIGGNRMILLSLTGLLTRQLLKGPS
jgi:hypothetical protein